MPLIFGLFIGLIVGPWKVYHEVPSPEASFAPVSRSLGDDWQSITSFWQAGESRKTACRHMVRHDLLR
jgi:hypothetical protein